MEPRAIPWKNESIFAASPSACSTPPAYAHRRIWWNVKESNAPHARLKQPICISCKTGADLPKLADEIYRRIGGAKLSAESPLAINARHRDQLRRASDAIARALAAIGAGATPEMFAIDLQEAQHAVDELLGGGDEEAVRDAIFSQFCIGK